MNEQRRAMTQIPTITPQYRCDTDGYTGPFDEAHENHLLFPEPVVGFHLVCENGCEQSGCNLSDCVAWVQSEGLCPLCDSPAHVEADNVGLGAKREAGRLG